MQLINGLNWSEFVNDNMDPSFSIMVDITKSYLDRGLVF
jgi:hypothetical protein